MAGNNTAIREIAFGIGMAEEPLLEEAWLGIFCCKLLRESSSVSLLKVSPVYAGRCDSYNILLCHNVRLLGPREHCKREYKSKGDAEARHAESEDSPITNRDRQVS